MKTLTYAIKFSVCFFDCNVLLLYIKRHIYTLKEALEMSQIIDLLVNIIMNIDNK